MKTKNACMLILTAFIWGTAFVAQSVGMDYLAAMHLFSWEMEKNG